jgi:hypothetical protein
MKRTPVVIQLYPKEIEKADLMKELRIQKHNLGSALRRQPGLYAWWSGLYSEVSAKTARIRERLEYLEARKAIAFSKKLRRKHIRHTVSDIKHYVSLSPEIRGLRKKLLRWENSERILKHAVRSFEQRKDVIMALNANVRAERKSEDEGEKRDEDS